MLEEYDIAIVGAGPAGSATAQRIAQCGYRVVLLERSCFEPTRVGESLAPATQPLLVELGLWSQFIGLSPIPSFGTRSLWGNTERQDHSHLMNPYGCGWHIDRLAFDRMLADSAVGAGAELRCGINLVQCELTNDRRWLLRFEENSSRDSTPLRARVLIDATGRASNLSRWVGAQRIIFDRLVGVATLFDDIDTSSEGYILVETTPDGWWYSAPVPGDRMIAMLMTDSDLCGHGKLSSLGRWLEQLACAPATAARVTGTVKWGPRVFSALSQRLRRREFNTPWIAVGDAALAVDPISGSGVVRALRSAHSVAETALELINGQNQHTIQTYEADRDLECTKYLYERALYYGLEQRWQESPFWLRRAVVPRN